MNIAVIGAGGSIGRQIAQMIVTEQLLKCDEHLILVGNPVGKSARSLYGYAVDIMDAYAEISPRIDVVLDPGEIRGDLIIMAGGATIPLEQNSGKTSRDDLAAGNLPVFETYAEALKKYGHGHEIVICVSNPNELAVAVFARHLGRKRVIGMGAFLDSLRFRKEIAQDLGIRRQRIHGYMAGEHGLHAVPLWSSIHIYGYEPEILENAIQGIRRGYETVHFHRDAAEAGRHLKDLVLAGKVKKAYGLIDQYPPDIRAVLKPFITHFSGSKTVTGTARATMDFIRTIMMGNDALVPGQIQLDGECYGIHSTIGVPFVIGNQGVDRIFEIPVHDDEKALMLQSAALIQEKLDACLS